MIAKLSQRDKRALKLGAVSVAAILVFVFATTWLEHWTQVRESLAAARDDLRIIKRQLDKYNEAINSLVNIKDLTF